MTIYRNSLFIDSKKIWKDTTEKCPNNGRAYYWLGDLYLKSYFANNDAKSLKYARTELEKAKYLIDIPLLLYYSDGKLMQVYYYENQYEKCLSQAEEMLNLINDRSKSISFVDKFSIYYYSGLSYRAIGKFENAIQSFTLAGQSRINDADVLKNLGECYFQIQDYDNAKLYFKKYFENSKTKDDAIIKMYEQITENTKH